MNLADRLPRILLVEDDPTSAGFLRAALENLPARVDCADTAAAARTAAATHRYTVWCIDANLPDGRGVDLLRELRGAGLDAMAVAHTADVDPAVGTALSAEGFAAVFTKPLSVDALHTAIRRALGADAHDGGDSARVEETIEDSANRTAALPLWDDAAALRALNGNHAILGAMRALYRKDLEAARPRIAQAAAAGDRDAILAELHKLKAGSGFVGAVRIAAAARGWQNAVGTDAGASTYRIFEDAMNETLATM